MWAMIDRISQALLHLAFCITAKWPCSTAPGVDDLTSSITLRSSVQLLGPFQIGTREAAWGADPLEIHGGFRNLSFDADAVFSSSLARNGTVRWKCMHGDIDSQSDLDLVVQFDDVDWASLRSVYGWSAFQYQAWARVKIDVRSRIGERILLYAPGAFELWVDEKHFPYGDFYSYENTPYVLPLTFGIHRVDLRMVRDVRASGGIGVTPAFALKVRTRNLQPGDNLVLLQHVFPDLLDDVRLASSHASLSLLNTRSENIHVTHVESQTESYLVALADTTGTIIAPSQIRPVTLHLLCVADSCGHEISITAKYRIQNSGETSDRLPIQEHAETFRLVLQKRSILQTHVFTYRHPSGIVSSALLRPPQENLPVDTAPGPILLNLHGAGVSIRDAAFYHSLDGAQISTAWTLSPQGSSLWSGDDWHRWGWADVRAGIHAIDEWTHHNSWTGIGADTEKWIVLGHSNGGQGTWYALTHYPDNVIAAAPLSGYSSIQNYVPYSLWTTAEPGQFSVLSAALRDYQHDLALGNACGIPLLIQHGGADDNVPAFHSRLMYDGLIRRDINATYIEHPGKGHWFDGIMTTPEILQFLKMHERGGTVQSMCGGRSSFTVSNPSSSGSKHGLSIVQLNESGQVGRVYVERHGDELRVATSNVQCLRISWPKICSYGIRTVRLDDTLIQSPDEGSTNGDVLRLQSPGSWVKSKSEGLQHPYHSAPGSGLDAILRTSSRFSIRFMNERTSELALLVSNGLYQYYGADSEVTTMTNSVGRRGNGIAILVGSEVHHLNISPHAFDFIANGIRVTSRFMGSKEYLAGRHGLAAVFLVHDEGHWLDIIIWGSDIESARMACRLLPLVPGAGLPDFIIFDGTLASRGLEAVLAMGFFNADWSISKHSYFL